MSEPVPVSQQLVKQMMRASWAAAAPALVPLVILVSVNQVKILAYTGLGRLGLTSIAVLFISLAFLFWRGRWWAAIPSLAIMAGALAWFTVKFIRPLMAYYAVNPIRDIGDILTPFGMVSFHLVVVLICLTLGLVVLKGMRICRQVEPRPVSGLFWGIAALWAVLLMGDLYYQKTGWREFGSPPDLMVRMCVGDEALKKEVKARLLKLGPKALPDLLAGVAAPDPDLGCLRDESRSLILAMGPAAGPGLLDAALKGDLNALRLVREGKLTGALKALKQHYQDPKRKSSPAYSEELKLTIKALDPEFKVD